MVQLINIETQLKLFLSVNDVIKYFLTFIINIKKVVDLKSILVVLQIGWPSRNCNYF